MRRKLGLIVLLLVAMILIAGLVNVFLPGAPPRPPKPLPNPNGYDALARAGRMISNDIYDYYTSTSHNDLASLVDQNSNVLQLVRIGLKQECRATVLDSTETSMSNHMAGLGGIKRLAYVLEAEGRLAEMENRPKDAATSYLDTIKVGINSYRGGIVIDAMVGLAIEAIGTKDLERHTTSLDSQSCRDIAAQLETIDAVREQWTNLVEENQDWNQRVPGHFIDHLRVLLLAGSRKKALQATEQKLDHQVIKTRRLEIEFAARAYELERQQKPKSIADLVPDYLKTIPQDPLTGTNMTLLP